MTSVAVTPEDVAAVKFARQHLLMGGCWHDAEQLKDLLDRIRDAETTVAVETRVASYGCGHVAGNPRLRVV